MYYLLGLVFCIGFVLGMAYGMTKGKKDLIADLQNYYTDSQTLNLSDLSNYIEHNKSI